MEVERKVAIDTIVKKYLLSRGYGEAAAAMSAKKIVLEEDTASITNNGSCPAENGISNGNSNYVIDDEETLTISGEILSTVVEGIVVLGVNSGNYGIYEVEYSCLRSWCLSSLDLVKSEVSLLLFPAFVHCYIGLIRLGCADEAIKFWRMSVQDHQEGYPDELRSLSMLTAKEQLESQAFLSANSFTRQTLTSRFLVKMSSFSYGLLTTFIVQNSYLLIASIMNDRINFEKISDFPGVTKQVVQFESNAADASSSSSRAVVLNTDTIKLTAPGRGGEHREDALSREWVNVLVRPRVFQKLKEKNHENSKHQSDKHDAEDRDEKKKTRFQTGGASRVKEVGPIGDALDPSVIFSTITNAGEGMTCLHISRGVTRAAAGFTDSSLRVWSLNEKDESAPKFSNLLSDNWTMTDVSPALPTKSSSSVGAGNSNGSSNGNGNNKKSSLRDVLELHGHSKPIYGVCQSSDEECRLVLSCSADETIRLWDTSVAQCVGKYHCIGPSWGVSFSPLGYYFAAANQDMTAAVYCTDRTAPLRLFTGHTSDVTAVCWHENANLIASCADDKTARLWDLRSGKCVRLFSGSPSPLCCLALSSAVVATGTASLLAAGTDTGSVCLWDVGSGRHVAVLQGHTDAVHSVSFSSDGSALASGGADCSLRIFDIGGTGVSRNTFTAPPSSAAASSSSSARHTGFSSTNKYGPTDVPSVCQPRHTYHTKFSPVYFVDYTDKNLLFSGGPFSLYCATSRDSQGAGRVEDRADGEGGRSGGTVERSAPTLTATEQETAAALGLSQSVISI